MTDGFMPVKETNASKRPNSEKEVNPKDGKPFGNSFELAQYVLKKVMSAQFNSLPSKAPDLTQSQRLLLRRIFSARESGIELKMSDLSAMLGSTKSAASQAVSKLERMSLVKRKWSKADRRRVLVELTQKGAAAVETMNRDFLEFIQTGLDKMEEDEIKVFVNIFEKFVN